MTTYYGQDLPENMLRMLDRTKLDICMETHYSESIWETIERVMERCKHQIVLETIRSRNLFVPLAFPHIIEIETDAAGLKKMKYDTIFTKGLKTVEFEPNTLSDAVMSDWHEQEQNLKAVWTAVTMAPDMTEAEKALITTALKKVSENVAEACKPLASFEIEPAENVLIPQQFDSKLTQCNDKIREKIHGIEQASYLYVHPKTKI